MSNTAESSFHLNKAAADLYLSRAKSGVFAPAHLPPPLKSVLNDLAQNRNPTEQQLDAARDFTYDYISFRAFPTPAPREHETAAAVKTGELEATLLIASRLPVVVTLELRNISDKPVAITKYYEPDANLLRGNVFKFEPKLAYHGLKVSKNSSVGKPKQATLEPGQAYVITIPLQDFYDFGLQSSIKIWYETMEMNTAGKSVRLRSNKLEFSVPGGTQ